MRGKINSRGFVLKGKGVGGQITAEHKDFCRDFSFYSEYDEALEDSEQSCMI